MTAPFFRDTPFLSAMRKIEKLMAENEHLKAELNFQTRLSQILLQSDVVIATAEMIDLHKLPASDKQTAQERVNEYRKQRGVRPAFVAKITQILAQEMKRQYCRFLHVRKQARAWKNKAKLLEEQLEKAMRQQEER